MCTQSLQTELPKSCTRGCLNSKAAETAAGERAWLGHGHAVGNYSVNRKVRPNHEKTPWDPQCMLLKKEVELRDGRGIMPAMRHSGKTGARDGERVSKGLGLEGVSLSGLLW